MYPQTSVSNDADQGIILAKRVCIQAVAPLSTTSGRALKLGTRNAFAGARVSARKYTASAGAPRTNLTVSAESTAEGT